MEKKLRNWAEVWQECISTVFDYVAEREQIYSRHKNNIKKAVQLLEKFIIQKTCDNINAVDDEPFYWSGDEVFSLAIRGNSIRVWASHYVIDVNKRHVHNPNDDGWDVSLENMSRYALESMVRHKHLPRFIKKTLKKLGKDVQDEELYKYTLKIDQAIWNYLKLR